MSCQRPLPSRRVDAPSPQAMLTPLPSVSIPPSPASMPALHAALLAAPFFSNFFSYVFLNTTVILDI
jgi:hypothetical protein